MQRFGHAEEGGDVEMERSRKEGTGEGGRRKEIERRKQIQEIRENESEIFIFIHMFI